MSEILVFVSMKDGVVSMPTKEVLGMARKIAGKRGDSVTAALVGADVSSVTEELCKSGADKVYVSTHEGLKEFHPAFYLKVLQRVMEKARANLIVFPGDEMGLDLAPRLAHRLGVGLVTDCIGIEIQDGIEKGAFHSFFREGDI